MLDDLCKSPAPITIGGKTYQVSPLTQGDFGDLIQSIEWAPLEGLRATGVTDTALLMACVKECSQTRLAIGTEDFNNALRTPRAQTEMAFLSLKHRHPDSERSELQAMSITDVGLIGDVCLCLTNPEDEDNQKKMKELRETKPTHFSG